MRTIKLFGRNLDIRNSTTVSLQDQELLTMLGITDSLPKDKLNQIVYFICMKTLCEIMGKLEIKKYKISELKGKEKVYDNQLNYLLNISPNPYYTASTLKQSIELNRNHHGNAYVYLQTVSMGRNAGKIDSLWILPSKEVQVWMDDKGVFGQRNALFYVWQDKRTGKQYKFSMDEIMHFKSSITFDGIMGMAIKDIIAMEIDTALHGQSYLQDLYKNKMQGGKIVIQYTGSLDTKAEKALVNKLEDFSASGLTGAYLPLPLGLQASKLDTKLVDAEFSALKQANALQIAAAFGIPPNIINDFSKSSYANSVTQQTAIYVNTMQPIFKAYSEEYTRRMIAFAPTANEILEIDTKALFKLNPIEQMEVLQKGSQTLAFTVNEMREELGLSYLDDEKANTPIGNGNLITLDMVGEQYKKNGGGN